MNGRTRAATKRKSSTSGAHDGSSALLRYRELSASLDRSMKLLFVCPNLGVAGAERQWSILIPRLAERGFEVRVLTLDGEGRFFHQLRNLGIDARCASMRNRFDLLGLRRALALSGHPDVVITRSVSSQVVGHAIARRAEAAHVFTEHLPVDGDGRMRPFRKDQKLLVRLVAPHVDLVVAVSASQIEGSVELGYRRERLRVISNAIPTDAVRVTKSRLDMRNELGLRDDDFVALFVANLRAEKRASVFVSGVVEAHVSNGRIRGIVAGSGPELDALRQQVEQTSGVVTALGDRADVADLLNAADVLCMCSIREAMPMNVLEAMIVGRPVVATKVGGVPDLVIPEETGFFFDPDSNGGLANVLVRLAGDEQFTKRMGRNAAVRTRKLFSVGKMVDAYADVLIAARELRRTGDGG
jgi:glycosyltransferase involved in cell wall biosynthesis